MTTQTPTRALPAETLIGTIPLWLIPLVGLLIFHCSEVIALQRMSFGGIIDPDTLMRLGRIIVSAWHCSRWSWPGSWCGSGMRPFAHGLLSRAALAPGYAYGSASNSSSSA